MAVSLLTEKHQISPNWNKYFKGDILDRDQRYREEVVSCMTYLKLKKVKRLILENQLDLEKEQTADDMMLLLQTHRHLKQLEMDLMKGVGTVIFK
jgi:DNA primase